MRIGDYVLVNNEKVDRAINGTVGAEGSLVGGVGSDDEALILAEYDRLGGLIMKDGKYKVKTGGFYDFKAKKPFKKPQPVLVFTVNGEVIEIDADEELPLEVQAAQLADEKKKKRKKKKVEDAEAKKAAKKAAKKKASKKQDIDQDDEDESDEEDTENDDEDEEAGDGDLA